jgi:hypothetical protein
LVCDDFAGGAVGSVWKRGLRILLRPFWPVIDLSINYYVVMGVVVVGGVGSVLVVLVVCCGGVLW